VCGAGGSDPERRGKAFWMASVCGWAACLGAQLFWKFHSLSRKLKSLTIHTSLSTIFEHFSKKEFFMADKDAWEQRGKADEWERRSSKQTKNWAISAGGSFEIGTVGFGGTKVLWFHNLELNEKRPFIMVSAGVGARLGAKFKSGGALDKLDSLGKVTKVTTDAYGNPLNASSPEAITVHSPFSFADLQGCLIGGQSVGADLGVSIGIEVLSFTKWRRSLFTMQSEKVEAILGVGINLRSFHGGFLFFPPGMTEAEAKKARAKYDSGFKPAGSSNQWL